MAKHIATLLFATTVLMGTSVAADENDKNFTLSLNGEIQESWVPTTTFVIDRNANTDTVTDERISLYGFSGDAAYRLSEDSFLSGTFLGNRPSIGLSISHLIGSSEGKDTYADAGVNSALGVDGSTPNTFWRAGTWTSKNDVKLSDVSLTITGTATPNSWSFVPEIGLAFRRYDLEHNVSRVETVGGAFGEITDGALDTNMYGGTLGLSVLSPVSDGWRFGAHAGVTAMATSTDMRVTQDPNSDFGLFPDLTVRDSDNSGFYEGTLQFSVEKSFGALSISTEVFGNANYGLPYIDGTTEVGTATKIGNDEMAYDLGGRLSLSFNF